MHEVTARATLRSTAAAVVLVLLSAAACAPAPEETRAQPAGATAQPSASAAPARVPSPPEPGFAPNEQLATAVTIPLRDDLTIVTAVNSAPGDYESIKRVESVSASGIRFTYSAEHPSSDGSTTETRTRRVVKGDDLANARVYRQGFSNNDEDVYPGSTALGVSALILTELKTKGSADVKVMPAGIEGMLGGAIGAFLGAGDDDASLVSGTLSRVGPVSVPVVVNDEPMLLPGIQARGRFAAEEAEFVFLDDPRNPIALRWRLAGEALQVIKISFPAERPAAQVMAEELRTEGRTEVHGIYFDLGSAVLRSESEAALRQIADALGANREWRVRLEGHTDGIGTAERNQALSEERAAAVKAALVSRFDVAADRLSTAGHGATKPKAPNDTLVGRARNRRVELVREGATE
ncbi:MAG: OmpA family protein [Acidobacteriota bacterium]|nr:OmpA family protein [Acidobacteriota bacterium]